MATSSSAFKTEPNDHDSVDSVDSYDTDDSDEEDPMECLCNITQDEESDIENFLNAKLEEAKKELENAVSLFGLLEDIKLHKLSEIQQRKQNDIITSMYRYVIYLHDLKSRKGRCKFCVLSENAAN